MTDRPKNPDGEPLPKVVGEGSPIGQAAAATEKDARSIYDMAVVPARLSGLTDLLNKRKVGT